MYAQAEKPKENKSRAVANTMVQKKKSVKQYADNRPETLAQGNLPDEVSNNNTLQRFAFIKGKLDQSNEYEHLEKDLNYTPNMMSIVKDDKVRDFESVEELAQYSSRQTDYIGNIEASIENGVWVRFPKEPGTILLGESHDATILAHITKAVGTDSFAHERFTDAQEYSRKVADLDTKENQSRLEEHGVGNEEGKFVKHQLESLKAKTAFVMNIVSTSVETKLKDWTAENFRSKDSKTHENAYTGKPALTYLKYAWNIMIDLKKAKGHALLASFDGFDWNEASNTFNLILEAPAESFLGDVDGINSVIIKNFADRFLIMTDKIMEDSEVLKNYKKQTKENGRSKYMLWRDAFIMDRIKKLPDNVRYIGMGGTHHANLEAEINSSKKVIFSAHLKNIMPKFKERTVELESKIKK